MDSGSNDRHAFALPGSTYRYGPDKTVDVLHIDLHLVPDLRAATIDATCTTTVRALDEAVSSLALDAVDLAIRSVERDGKPLAFATRGKKLDIRFDPPIAPEEEASFAVIYRVTRPRHGAFFVEPSPEYPNKIRHLWTQCQDENARYWFPCLDYPHEKQTTSATIVVENGLFALSNGELVERRDDGDKTTFRYRQDVPHATYLVTLVVGPFAEVRQTGASVPIFYYVLPGREADGERAFGKTPRMVSVFEERIGTPYPYARYSQIAVDEFIFGGMENTAATTQTDRTLHDERAHLDYSSDWLVAHELAHQWFGDLLTCRDWSHAWLNEGFATFFEAVFREADLGRDEYLYDIFGCVQRYLREDAERYRRPIVYNRFRDPVELFDRHLYEKGAAVLHMLRGELGEARFWRSMRTYVRENAQRNVETIDFIRAIETSTGRNMREFFDQWVFRGGHPKLGVRASYDAARRAVSLTIEQKQTIDDDHPAYRFAVEVAFAPHDGPGRSMRVFVEHGRETVTVPLDFEPELVRFDPGATVLADVTYEFGVEFSAASLSRDPDPVARIRAARELAKDGSQRARDALREALTKEQFWGVLAESAHAAGETHAPWACELLIDALAHAHPKVRRAAADALGNFRGANAVQALSGCARSDASYLVRSAALTSLGKTRDAAAFGVLRGALDEPSWNSIVAAAAATGLGELGDRRAGDLLVAQARPGIDESVRSAALVALARHAALVESARPQALDEIAQALHEPGFFIIRAAIGAAESLADRRFLASLDRLSESAFDGRLRRDAAEAATRIRESLKIPSQVSGLRTDLDELREQQRKLQEQIETLARS